MLANEEVSGRRGGTVFLAIPTATRVRQSVLVVIATDRVDLTVLHDALPLMLLAGLIVLVGVGMLSIWLARRLTRPIRAIERTATQLATGDLSARGRVFVRRRRAGTLARTQRRWPPSSSRRAAASTRSCSRSRTICERRSRRSAATPRRSPTARSTTPIRTNASAATIIGAEGRRLERLVRDLLDLSRLDSHQFSLKSRPCDATEIVRDAAEAFAPQARELGIGLNVVSGGALAVDLDPERLAQIVANLIENALKYATAQVEVYAAPQDDGHVAVVVVDDGPGIPADQAARCSSGSTRCGRRPGEPSEPGSVSRSCASSRRRWAGAHGPKPRPAAGRVSSSPYR